MLLYCIDFLDTRSGSGISARDWNQNPNHWEPVLYCPIHLFLILVHCKTRTSNSWLYTAEIFYKEESWWRRRNHPKCSFKHEQTAETSFCTTWTELPWTQCVWNSAPSSKQSVHFWGKIPYAIIILAPHISPILDDDRQTVATVSSTKMYQESIRLWPICRISNGTDMNKILSAPIHIQWPTTVELYRHEEKWNNEFNR